MSIIGNMGVAILAKAVIDTLNVSPALVPLPEGRGTRARVGLRPLTLELSKKRPVLFYIHESGRMLIVVFPL